MSNRQITIAVDAMGGENSPFKILKGSEIFLMHNKNVNLLFFGNSKKIEDIIKKNNLNLSNYEIFTGQGLLKTNSNSLTLNSAKFDEPRFKISGVPVGFSGT